MATNRRTSATPAQTAGAERARDPTHRVEVANVNRGPLVVDIRQAQEAIDTKGFSFPPGAEDFIKGNRNKNGAPDLPYAHLADSRFAKGYIAPISDDWNAGSSVWKRGTPNANETRIQLVLVDDSDKDNRCSFDAGASTTLKALFNEYADRRGVSLRSLRFSYRGEALFLSNAGRKTPEELGLRDKDVIVVQDASRSISKGDDEPKQRPATSKKTKAKKKSTNKKTKSKRKNKAPPQRGESSKTLEEYKIEHSKRLTKIHGEAHDQFRRIRQRLNSLVIERRQPKMKSRRPRFPKDAPPSPSTVNDAFDGGLGGKAGRSRYAIHVGEVQNLYKTTKPSAVASSHNRSLNDAPSILDLHGCTRDEARARLDDALEVWVDAAMRGSYPFVLPATIVCGCGDQVLSETVREWIRANDRVSNAPRARPLR